MTTNNIVFLFDVDNTLLDNDRVTADLKRYFESEVGSEGQQRYFAIFEQLRAELGYADYLGASDNGVRSAGTLCERLTACGELPPSRREAGAYR